MFIQFQDIKKVMIKKFKTFEEARRDLWVSNPDQEYYDRLRAFFDFTEKLIDFRTGYKPGVYKFKTIQEADKDRREKRMAVLQGKKEN